MVKESKYDNRVKYDASRDVLIFSVASSGRQRVVPLGDHPELGVAVNNCVDIDVDGFVDDRVLWSKVGYDNLDHMLESKKDEFGLREVEVRGGIKGRPPKETRLVSLKNAYNPLRNAALTIKSSDKTFGRNWRVLANDISIIAKEMSEGDKSAGYQFLLAHVMVLDEIFNKLARAAADAKNTTELSRILNLALSAQRQSKNCMDTLIKHEPSSPEVEKAVAVEQRKNEAVLDSIHDYERVRVESDKEFDGYSHFKDVNSLSREEALDYAEKRGTNRYNLEFIKKVTSIYEVDDIDDIESNDLEEQQVGNEVDG